MELFIKRLRELIESRDMTQKELAKAIDITEVTISRYLSGDRKPRIDIIDKIAKYFNVSTDYLLGAISEGKNTYTVPEEFTDPVSAREYVNRHQIFGSQGFDVDKLDDEDVVKFANELLEQMAMVSWKYRK